MPDHQQIQQSKKPDTTFQKQATPLSQTPASNPYSTIQRAKINPRSLTHADVMQLQQTIGNRAVGRLLSGIGSFPTAQQATVQRQEIPEEEEPLQGKFIETIQRQEIPEEEEPLQGKMAETIQRQPIPEGEESLQGKMIETVQRQEIPKEEEPLQGKMVGTIQRQEVPDEEEPLQGKMADTIQCQEIPEEEEPLQGKMIETVQRQEILDEEEPLQGKFESIQRQEIPEEEEPLQTKRENNTGMPDNLKAGVESLSGMDMNDVRVHYNSNKPPEVGALAYTQGTDIHVAPGQEKYLPHEAWHVVQQAQGRVRPTIQLKDILINDDAGLEKEADIVGTKIARTHKKFFAPTQRKYAVTKSFVHRDDLQGNIIQCTSLKTLGGTWEDIEYRPAQNGDPGVPDMSIMNGVRIKLEFTPEDPTDAEVIGLSQAVKSEQKEGGSLPQNPFFNPYINPSDAHAGEYQIDQYLDSGKNNPLYAGDKGLKGSSLDEPALAGLGQHGKRVQNAGVWEREKAKLEDTPVLWKYVNGAAANGFYERESQLFETTATAVRGRQLGTYYGSVSWGWSADSTGNMTINPLTVSSNGVPSEAFMRAANKWNTNANLRDLPETSPLKVNFKVGYHTVPGQDIYVSGNVPDLGMWDVQKKISLNYENPDYWSRELRLNGTLDGSSIEYKYIMQDKTGNLRWEKNPNHTRVLPNRGNSAIFNDDWHE